MPAARKSPYEVILGPAFASLAPGVQRAHLAPIAAAGTLDVQHGSHWLRPLLIPLMHLPAAGTGQATRVDVEMDGADLRWSRRIGSSILVTRQRADGPLLVERLGIGRIAFALAVEGGTLFYRQVSTRVAGIAVPSFLSPRVTARVSAAALGWHVDVEVNWRAHLLCRYAGTMAPL